MTSAIQNRGLTTPITANRMLTLTTGTSFVVQLLLIYFPPLQGVFQTTSLSLSDLLLLFFVAGIGFVSHEARRRWERRREAAGKDGEAEEMIWGGTSA